MDETPYAATFDAERSLLTVTGSVDELAGPTFRSDLEKYSDRFAQDLTVDLSLVEFFPSLAVGVIAVAGTSARRAGHELTVVAAPGTLVSRVLTICGMPHRERA